MSSFDWIPPPLPTLLTARFSLSMRAVTDAVLAQMNAGRMTFALGQFISSRVVARVNLVVWLIAALKAGTLKARRSPPPGLTRARRLTWAQTCEGDASPAPAWALRGRGWLFRMLPGHMLSGGPLQTLVDDPEMLGLLAASPRLVRTLKPLCRMMAVTMPKLPELPPELPPVQPPPVPTPPMPTPPGPPPAAGPEGGAEADGEVATGAAAGVAPGKVALRQRDAELADEGRQRRPPPKIGGCDAACSHVLFVPVS